MSTDQPREYHFILAVQKPAPGGGGYAVADWSGVMTPAPDWTRHDTYLAIREEHVKQNPAMRGAALLFFSLEPNQL
ncbi:hypothetical protein ACFCV8_00895 [Streptomyces sp. NPDC056347]|uniref:hypothetical protein n=1 Tax=Streptomyces sp. NPDC056347 TaxID=3345790 RepID=UPI0035E13168